MSKQRGIGKRNRQTFYFFSLFVSFSPITLTYMEKEGNRDESNNPLGLADSSIKNRKKIGEGSRYFQRSCKNRVSSNDQPQSHIIKLFLFFLVNYQNIKRGLKALHTYWILLLVLLMWEAHCKILPGPSAKERVFEDFMSRWQFSCPG